MENTLKVGDHVGVKEEAQPVRGSVVVFVGPDSWQDTPDAAGPKKDFVKRVIGLGGEHVVCCDAKGRITVDGQALDEPYLFPGDRASEISFDVKVPRDRLFVLGDHRMASADSRVHLSDGSNGTVPLANVIGVVVKVQAPDGRVSPLPTPQYDR